jgi:hypothetical protein
MITNGRQNVNGTSTKIATRSHHYSTLFIYNDDETKDLYIGNENVTIANGFKVDRSGTQQFELPPLNDLYMISDGGAHQISWLRIEKD